MNTITTPLKWHGGKHYLAKRIVSLMPPHIHYVELFAGGLSVLLAKNPDGVSEVANDLNLDLTNFWSVLSHPRKFARFYRAVSSLPFSRHTWDDSFRRLKTLRGSNERHFWAAAFFVVIRQSLSGRGKDFAPLSRTRTRRGMNEQVSAWLSAIDGLPEVHARLRRVVVERMDAIDLIKREDGPQTFLYCDPPYLQSTRTAKDVYDCEMLEEQHHQLLDTLGSIKGKFALSGYPSAMYEEAEKKYGWRRVDFDLPNNSASGGTKRRMTECLWMNYDFQPVLMTKG